jgi:membrane protein implicated in regulation of membrane protease activity
MLDLFHQSLLTIGIISSSLVLVLFLLSLFGVDSLDGVEADFDGDFDGGIMQYLSLRNLASFLAIFSWSYLGLEEAKIFTDVVVFLISIFISTAFVFLLNSIFAILYKQQQNNILKETDIIGKEGTVITTIGINTTGQVEIYSPKFMVLDATSSNQINSGTKVRITKYSAGSCVVEKI